MGYRRLRVVTPCIGSYYAVVDDEYRPHELASRWLEVRFFGRAQAETTSAQYASSVALFLTWAEQTGRDLPAAARDMHLFAAYLAATPLATGGRAGHPRSPGRVNRILVAVREFYRFGAAERALAPEVLNYLYEPGHEPEFRSRAGPRVRHRRREPRRAESPDQATAEEVCGLLGEASSARDQFLILLLALTGSAGGTGPRAASTGSAPGVGRRPPRATCAGRRC